eukprot:m.89619 g.89619  ORF g.89619 m.89619 type:complete len:229 (-) comp11760_c0_seq1:278-964(-)
MGKARAPVISQEKVKVPGGTTPICDFCGGRARCACPLCRKALYCNRQCQVKHYPQHKTSCDGVVAAAAATPEPAQPPTPEASNGKTQSGKATAVLPAVAESQLPPAAVAPKAAAKGKAPAKKSAVVPKETAKAGGSTTTTDGATPRYQCTICNNVYKQSSSLKQHLNSHKGIKPFACDEPGCSGRFAARSALKRHAILHTGARDHTCEHCGKGFARKDALHQHMRVHS